MMFAVQLFNIGINTYGFYVAPLCSVQQWSEKSVSGLFCQACYYFPVIMIVLQAHKQTVGEFLISLYICTTSQHSFLAFSQCGHFGIVVFPPHHPNSSQGHVLPWEFTKDFSVIKEPVLSLLRSNDVFTDVLTLQVEKKKVFSDFPVLFLPLNSEGPAWATQLRIFLDSLHCPIYQNSSFCFYFLHLHSSSLHKTKNLSNHACSFSLAGPRPFCLCIFKGSWKRKTRRVCGKRSSVG